jgi:transcriptional regulator GlxA family with amidase domain
VPDPEVTAEHRRGTAVPGREKILAFPVYPGVTPLDLIGPLTVLNTPGVRGTRYRTVVVGERTEQLATDTPLRLLPAATFAEVPNPWAVIVPGGGAATLAAAEDDALVSYVRSTAPAAEVVGSIGNGALVLAAADLLRGKRAAVHWAFREPLEKMGAIPVTERWLVDGRLQTAAGGTAGMDMALLLLARLRSKATAQLAQLSAEYDPQPPFGRVGPAPADDQLARTLRDPGSASAADPGGAGARDIAFVLYPGLTVLDAVGPLQVLTMLQRLAPSYRTVTVWARREPVPTDVGVSMVPDRTFEEVPHPAIVVVPGGALPTIRAMSDPLVRGYVRSAAASAELIASVCTGSLILGAVGLLEGRDATTNWFYPRILEGLGARYRRRRWVEDGNVITSAGVSAGIDMALHLAARLTDEATARRVQRAIDYDPQPPWGGIDYAHIPSLPRAMRGAIGLTAPLVTARPRRLARAGR